MECSEKEIVEMLREVVDPEIPAVNIVEMGIVRRAICEGNRVVVEISPTYSGCPALDVIETEIVSLLKNRGFTEIAVSTVFSPAWSTDMITAEAKRKMRESGIAPPPDPTVELVLPAVGISCPHCGSSNTGMKSTFGSTPCKALCFCNECLQPFEYFKPL